MSQKFDIIITEFMDQNAVDRIGNQFETHYNPSLHSDSVQLHKHLNSTVGLIVRNQTQVNTELLDSAPNLKVIGRLGVGLDNIDVEACSQRNIKVIPATGANSIAVTEYVLATMLILLRGVFSKSNEVVSGKWPRKEMIGNEIGDKVLGLVGYGEIAQKLAERASVLEMTVLAYDPFISPDSPVWNYASSTDLDGVIRNSDVVSLHVPLTSDTRNLIGAAEFVKMKGKAILINTSRGGIVDESALAEALKNGEIAGAAMDVFESEPMNKKSGEKFKNLPNLILTPHIAGITHESNVRVSDIIADAVINHLTESN